MSTRATYVIDGHAFYIHHDGYPDGAARLYFAPALAFTGPGDFAARFFRANVQAEFTKSHETHGDTQYRYTYDSSTNELRVWSRAPGNPWKAFFVGGLAAFMNKYAPTEDPDGAYMAAYGTVMTLGAVKTRAKADVVEAMRHLANGWSGNANGILNDVARRLLPLEPLTMLGDDWEGPWGAVTASFNILHDEPQTFNPITFAREYVERYDAERVP